MTRREPPEPTFLDAGECALVVQYGTTVDPGLSDAVLALDAALAASPPAGVEECVPTYRSLMIHYDPLIISRDQLIAHVMAQRLETAAPRQRRLWTLPACYDDEFGEDLGFVAERQRLTKDEIIRLHSTARYRIYMFGFAPGLAYLGGGPPELTLPRRTTPRDRVPECSLIIAGGLAIVMTVAMPSGWHVIGRTPVRLFAPEREPVFLGAPGDEMTFDRVDRLTYDTLRARAVAGEVIARVADVPQLAERVAS